MTDRNPEPSVLSAQQRCFVVEHLHAATQAETLAAVEALVRECMAQARLDALREAYFLLEALAYEPVKGAYPEGHIARLIHDAERSLPSTSSAPAAPAEEADRG